MYRIDLTYLDGTTKQVFPSPRARIETERHFGGLTPANSQEATLYLAWAHLKKAGEASEEFDPWVDLLKAIDEVQVKAEDAVLPTQPAQPAGTSSDSASEPASLSTS